MPYIQWCQYQEKAVGRGSPKYEDVINRPLRQIVELHGFDPDVGSFPGLFYFPLGAYTDDVSEYTLNHGIHLHHAITVDGNITFMGGKFTHTASDDVTFHLGGHNFNIDLGDIHLTNGQFYGKLHDIEVTSTLTADFGSTVTIDGVFDASANQNYFLIGLLQLNATPIDGATSKPIAPHRISNIPLVGLDAAVGAEKLFFYVGGGLLKTYWLDDLSVALTYESPVGLFGTHYFNFGARVAFGDQSNHSPASGGSGVPGEIAWDAAFLYVCVAANTWRRVATTGGY